MNMKKISALLALTFVSSNAAVTVLTAADVLANQNAGHTSVHNLLNSTMDKFNATFPSTESVALAAQVPVAIKTVTLDHNGSFLGGGSHTMGGSMTGLGIENINAKSINNSHNAANATAVGNTLNRTVSLAPVMYLQPTTTSTGTSTSTTTS